MNFRRLAIASILFAVGILAFSPAVAAAEAPGAGTLRPGTYKIDPVHSSVVFGIRHLGITYVYGRFNAMSGTLTIGEENHAIEMTVETAGIDTNNEKRDRHLRSEDFFDAESHPAISFKSASFAPTDEDTFEVSGELTLHGVTRPMTVTARHTGSGEDPWGGFRTGFQTVFGIRRSDFGMDKLMNSVGDEVELTVSIQAILQ
jgi:polyisoprenoid-binding protein YceI